MRESLGEPLNNRVDISSLFPWDRTGRTGRALINGYVFRVCSRSDERRDEGCCSHAPEQAVSPKGDQGVHFDVTAEVVLTVRDVLYNVHVDYVFGFLGTVPTLGKGSKQP